ncbi:immune inhibitor A domain-containing protein [Shewanella psychropiezotolerans]|nr:immune inhibitor A domain-containing protein [Shewanella psychropiezotolerans]
MKRISSIRRRSLISLSLSLMLSVTASTSLFAKELDAKLELSSALSSGEFAAATLADAGMINKEQILYWLIKRGEVSADASEADKRAAVDKFTHRATSFQSKGRLIEAQFDKARLKSLAQSKKLKRNSIAKMDNMVGTLADADITKTVKVLGILIDFPDLPFDNNRLSADDDIPMFYPNYPVSHYNDLMFSTTGFTGPQGQNLLTGYQYYQAESGERFNFTGNVEGWFRAANNAAFYGGNDPDNNDDDKAVPELVKEAVTQAVASMSPSELASYDVEDPFDVDGDGNLDEADGDIDHVMLFHSSIGEEAGGGVLGDDAIWSHRYFVYTGNTSGYTIPGTGKKVFGYTIQPINAAAGVVVHEFGHDLGLPDEYDTTNTGDGSPVGSWSVMSTGSWAGTIAGFRAGTEPTGFSPYARSYLQDRYKGRWINEQEVLLSSIGTSGLDVVINEAVNHSLVNQISIPLPSATIPFKQPYGGSYQYYSGQGHLINNALSFEIDLPSSTPLTLTVKAHWNIEVDYDYAQVMVDGVALAGNHTKASNTINTARDIISGNSGNIDGAEGANNWVDLEFDLSSFAGMSKQISIIYKTDQADGDYGFVFDNLQITNGISVIYSDDAETPNTMMLNGFSRIDDERPGAARRYIVQLRSHNGVDVGLDSESYEPGVLLWLENFSYSDNNSSAHPGAGLIGVIDADQNLIGTNDSGIQVRDATFSMFNQSSYVGDNHLSSISMFDDSQGYSAPLQPQSGILLPELGLTMEVVAQTADSSTATVRFNYGGTTPPPASDLASSFSASQEVAGTVVFSAIVTGGDGNYSYLWNFGVTGTTSAEEMPTYVYEASGSYIVNLTVTDGLGSSVVTSQTIMVALPVPPVAGFTFVTNDLSVTFTDTTTGGEGVMTYSWEFGDSQTSTAQSPSHTYASAGTYTVMMTVTDSLGVVSSRSTSITVITAVVTLPVTTPSGDSGGSLGWLSLGLLALMGFRRSRH